MKYVENLINDEYLRWNVGEKVLISSQTGSGKTTFILKKLLPYAISQNKKIVYFCNRRILRDQLDVEAEKQLKICFGNDVELSAEEMKYINITTYQSCEIAENFKCYPKTLRFKKQQDNVEIKHDEVLYYVFDEAHYFTEDALFNPETNYWDMDIFKNGVSVFLTATPEPLRLFLCEQIKYNNTDPSINNALRFNDYNMFESIRKNRSFDPLFAYVASAKEGQVFHHEYVDENDYGYIDAKYFHTYDDIFACIKSSKDKWLIFVDRENDGVQLCERLKLVGISSTILSAKRLKKKKSDEYRELTNIVLNHQFDCQVLISTSVMDCGVSIVDPALKHIVISQINKTSFLQMLGRKRVANGERITVYIRNATPRVVNGYRSDYEEKLCFVYNFATLNENKTVFNRKWTKESDGGTTYPMLGDAQKARIMHDFQKKGYTSSLVWQPNKLGLSRERTDAESKNKSAPLLSEFRYSTTALLALANQLQNCTEAVAEHCADPDVTYLKRQLSWLNKSYDETAWLNYQSSRDTLWEYLNSCVGKRFVLKGKKHQSFCECCCQLFEDFPVRPKCLKNLRKGKLPGKSLLNKAFEEIGFPFSIESRQSHSRDRKTYWSVVHME